MSVHQIMTARIAAGGLFMVNQVRFSYFTGDPFAVFLNVEPGNTWLLSRDMLWSGIMYPQYTEGGDVRILPVGLELQIQLEVDGYGAVICVNRERLRRFLLETYMSVPAGEESVNWEQLLA